MTYSTFITFLYSMAFGALLCIFCLSKEYNTKKILLVVGIGNIINGILIATLQYLLK